MNKPFGLLLFFVATILCMLIAPLGWIFGCVKLMFSGGVNGYNRKCALSIDQTGNAICSELFNSVLIKKDGYLFGSPDETISSVLGKNYLQGTLTTTGKAINSILNSIEKNHTIKSIDNTVKPTN